MSRLNMLLAASCALLMTACVPIPFKSAEDRARMQQDLALEHMPPVLLPLKWSYFEYGVQTEGVDTVDTVALVQPGSLTLVGYEKGHYVRQAEITSASTDCMYIFKGDVSAEPVWLLRADRPVFLSTGDTRGVPDVNRRKMLIDQMTAAGFRTHTDTQGKAYQPTGVIEHNLVLMPGSGQHIEAMAQNQAYNVCQKRAGQ